MNPAAWKIIDGKLYLSWDKTAADKFERKASAKIKQADQVWAKIREQN